MRLLRIWCPFLPIFITRIESFPPWNGLWPVTGLHAEVRNQASSIWVGEETVIYFGREMRQWMGFSQQGISSSNFERCRVQIFCLHLVMLREVHFLANPLRPIWPDSLWPCSSFFQGGQNIITGKNRVLTNILCNPAILFGAYLAKELV